MGSLWGSSKQRKSGADKTEIEIKRYDDRLYNIFPVDEQSNESKDSDDSPTETRAIPGNEMTPQQQAEARLKGVYENPPPNQTVAPIESRHIQPQVTPPPQVLHEITPNTYSANSQPILQDPIKVSLTQGSQFAYPQPQKPPPSNYQPTMIKLNTIDPVVLNQLPNQPQVYAIPKPSPYSKPPLYNTPAPVTVNLRGRQDNDPPPPISVSLRSQASLPFSPRHNKAPEQPQFVQNAVPKPLPPVNDDFATNSAYRSNASSFSANFTQTGFARNVIPDPRFDRDLSQPPTLVTAFRNPQLNKSQSISVIETKVQKNSSQMEDDLLEELLDEMQSKFTKPTSQETPITRQETERIEYNKPALPERSRYDFHQVGAADLDLTRFEHSSNSFQQDIQVPSEVNKAAILDDALEILDISNA